MGVNIDLHTHSRHGSFDGTRSYAEIAEECSSKGIDVVLITEHDKPTQPEDLAEISKRYRVLLLPGIEITFTGWGHFLILGGEDFLKSLVLRGISKKSITEVFERIKKNMLLFPGDLLTYDAFMEAMSGIRGLFKENLLTPFEFCQAARANGAFVSWAHPFIDTPLRRALDQFLIDQENLDMPKFIPYLQENYPPVFEVVSAVDAIEGLNGRSQVLRNYLVGPEKQLNMLK